METIKINLDKICAEYGMDLLKEFSNIEFNLEDVKTSLQNLENVVDKFKFSTNQNEFDNSKIDSYKNALENEIKKVIDDVNAKNLKEVEKYLIITWLLYALLNNVCKKFDFKKIKDIVKEKKRISNALKDVFKKFKFEFSASQFETEITKALGILVEDGPFAYMIWLKSQDKEPHRAMLIQTARILARLNVIRQINSNEDLKKEIEDEFLKASGDLTKSLFIKTILEKMLVYARYKAKAMQNE